MCSSGFKSSLSINSDENGHARVTLEVDIGFLQPPLTVPPPTSPSPKKIKRSPGYYRRLQRRKEFRQQLSSTNDSKVDETEEVSVKVSRIEISNEVGHEEVSNEVSHKEVSNEVIHEEVTFYNACESTVPVHDVEGIHKFFMSLNEMSKLDRF